MNRTRLPIPPNPADYTNVGQWQLATFRWMTQIKSRIEADSIVNTSAIGPYVVGTYTAVNTVTGTDALSNFVASLVTGMQAQGITTPVQKRTD